MSLKTNYQDDQIDVSKNPDRRFRITDLSSGVETDVTIEDITNYLKAGTVFGANDINATNTAINDLATLLGSTTLPTTAQTVTSAIDELNSDLTNLTDAVKITETINVSNYNSANNTMNCGADGYIKLVADGAVNNATRAYLMPSNTLIAAAKVALANNSATETFYVKKGMELYFTLSEKTYSSVTFYKLGIS